MNLKFLFIILCFVSLFFFAETFGQDNETGIQCGMKMTDSRDGRTYSTVRIGNQCWMAENLNAGTKISLLKDQRDNGIIEKYCYDNSEEKCKIYGGLYQWDEIMQYIADSVDQGICPEGWRLPSDHDWCILATTLDPTVNCSIFGSSGTTIGMLKSARTIESGEGLWYYPNEGADDSCGFRALPAGTRSIYSKFFFLGYHAYFWTSTPFNDSDAWFWYLKYSNNSIYREHYFKASGYSVRCIR